MSLNKDQLKQMLARSLSGGTTKYMNTSKVNCSLCLHDIPASELRAHREQETREIVDYTIAMIQSRHPEWTQGDPTCQLCWDYYRNLPSA